MTDEIRWRVVFFVLFFLSVITSFLVFDNLKVSAEYYTPALENEELFITEETTESDEWQQIYSYGEVFPEDENIVIGESKEEEIFPYADVIGESTKPFEPVEDIDPEKELTVGESELSIGMSELTVGTSISDNDKKILAQVTTIQENSTLFLYFIIPSFVSIFLVWKFCEWFYNTFIRSVL